MDGQPQIGELHGSADGVLSAVVAARWLVYRWDTFEHGGDFQSKQEATAWLKSPADCCRHPEYTGAPIINEEQRWRGPIPIVEYSGDGPPHEGPQLGDWLSKIETPDASIRLTFHERVTCDIEDCASVEKIESVRSQMRGNGLDPDDLANRPEFNRRAEQLQLPHITCSLGATYHAADAIWDAKRRRSHIAFATPRVELTLELLLGIATEYLDAICCQMKHASAEDIFNICTSLEMHRHIEFVCRDHSHRMDWRDSNHFLWITRRLLGSYAHEIRAGSAALERGGGRRRQPAGVMINVFTSRPTLDPVGSPMEMPAPMTPEATFSPAAGSPAANRPATGIACGTENALQHSAKCGRGRPTKIPLAAKSAADRVERGGGTWREVAKELYRTQRPTDRQVRDAPKVLKYFRSTLPTQKPTE